MLQKMSSPKLDDERGEGPPDEVGLGNDEKVTEEEEPENDVGGGGEEENDAGGGGEEEFFECEAEVQQKETEKLQDEEEQEKGVGEGGEEEAEHKETERLQDEERVDEDTEMLQGNDAQETSKYISQVSTVLLIVMVTVGMIKILFVFQRRLKTNASCLHSPYSTR